MRDRVKHLTDNEFLGKVALVTGANSGIGEAATLELARRKAKVIMLVRCTERGEAACKRIRAAYPAADLQLAQADLSLTSSVVLFCQSLKERVDILVNNAGVFGVPYSRTKEGVETVLAANHLGHFLLTCLMLADGRLSSTARIIVVTGAMYTRGSRRVADWDAWCQQNYRKVQAYRDSKLAVCLFALWLRSAIRRILGSSAKVFAVHPGVVHTEISRHMLLGCAGPFRACLLGCAHAGMLTPYQGCQSIVMCAADHDDSLRSGAYFNADREEAWHRAALDPDLVLSCWDFSRDLALRSLAGPDADQSKAAVAVASKLKQMRELPRDTLDDLAV